MDKAVQTANWAIASHFSFQLARYQPVFKGMPVRLWGYLFGLNAFFSGAHVFLLLVEHKNEK